MWERDDYEANQSMVGAGAAASVVGIGVTASRQDLGYVAGLLTFWQTRKAEKKAGSMTVYSLSRPIPRDLLLPPPKGATAF